ncbi:MAG: hypothetical protein Q7T01_02410 [bacterium]|nr:hypothetical protein [bacterium]
MQPMKCLVAAASGRNVLVSAQEHVRQFFIIGATVPVSCQLGEGVISAIITLPPGCYHGLIAIACYLSSGKWDSWLLSVDEQTGGRVFLALGSPFVSPRMHAVPQIVGSRLDVRCGDAVTDTERYTTDAHAAKQYGMRLVRDGNLLVRLIEDPAAIEDVRAAAEEVEREQSEIEKLREKIAELLEENGALEARNDDLEQQLTGVQREYREVSGAYNTLCEQACALYDFIAAGPVLIWRGRVLNEVHGLSCVQQMLIKDAARTPTTTDVA